MYNYMISASINNTHPGRREGGFQGFQETPFNSQYTLEGSTSEINNVTEY